MSPFIFRSSASDAVQNAIRRFWAELGSAARDARLAKGWTSVETAEHAGVSRTSVYTLERGEPVSIEVALRVVTTLGLRLEVDMVDPRRRQRRSDLSVDPVHSAMGELESGHLRKLSFPVAIDEPYQHFQFAGRADVIAWDVAARALLHIENRTRFPNVQETAGSFNAKRAYLGRVLAERFAIQRWQSETHVIVALWSAEVLHALRSRSETFRALCPDEPVGFAGWWRGQAPAHGTRRELVVLDPLAKGRQRSWISLTDALFARPRHRGYAEVARLLTRAA